MTPLSGNPGYDQLMAENQRLRQQLAQQQRGLHVDLEQDRLTLSGVEHNGIKVDNFSITVPKLSELTTSMLNPATLLNASKGLELPDLSQIARMPMRVESAHLEVTEATLNQVVSGLQVDGARELQVHLGEGGKIELSGYKSGFFAVPFRLEGQLSRLDAQHVVFSPQKTRVAGFIPVPKMLTNLFASLASRELDKMHVAQRGDDFVVDIAGYIPKNLQMGLQSLTTQSGKLVLEAGSQ